MTDGNALLWVRLQIRVCIVLRVALIVTLLCCMRVDHLF